MSVDGELLPSIAVGIVLIYNGLVAYPSIRSESEPIRRELCDAKVQGAAITRNETVPAGLRYVLSSSDGTCVYVSESGMKFEFNALKDVPRLAATIPAVGGMSAPAASAPAPAGR